LKKSLTALSRLLDLNDGTTNLVVVFANDFAVVDDRPLLNPLARAAINSTPLVVDAGLSFHQIL
jgi:hypothetical protein